MSYVTYIAFPKKPKAFLISDVRGREKEFGIHYDISGWHRDDLFLFPDEPPEEKGVLITDKKDATFKAWLYRIAANKTVDYFRSRTYQEAVKTLPLDEIEPIAEADFVRMFEKNEFTEKVCAFVGGMPQDTQKIFQLHIFGEHTFAEIAVVVRMPESSVKSKYYRLINLLRKEFANYG